MKIQEIRARQAMDEIGMKGEVRIVHAEDVKTFINDKEYKLVFPKFIMDYNEEKTIEMIFIGLLTQKRKVFLDNFKEAIIISSDKGRKQETKEKDDEYFKLLSKSKFSICPNGDFVWTYRFFESILCKCLPIVEEDCKLYEGYKYYKVGDNYCYNKDWIEHNLNKIKEMMLWM